MSMAKPQPDLPGTIWPAEFSAVPLPVRLAKRFGEFVGDGLTGNITINVRDGEILGMQIEEKVKL
jgi:hypothetical protein